MLFIDVESKILLLNGLTFPCSLINRGNCRISAVDGLQRESLSATTAKGLAGQFVLPIYTVNLSLLVAVPTHIRWLD
jgi:hypothetical protein